MSPWMAGFRSILGRLLVKMLQEGAYQGEDHGEQVVAG
jgi:hypothetical protein